MASEAALLRAMSLTPRDEANDAVIPDRRAWAERRKFQNDIFASNLCEDKPEGLELFTVAGSSKDPICHLMIPSPWSPPAYPEVTKMGLQKN